MSARSVSALYLEDEERALLIQLLQGAIREVRDELTVTQTKQVKALIKPREILLTGLLKRLQIPADPTDANQE